MSALLKTIFDDAILPALFAALAVQFPWFGFFLKIPIVGPAFKKVVEWGVNWLLDKGVIELKVGLLNLLSAKAQAAYADQIKIIREAQAQDELTPEQLAEYARRLQDVVKNRPGVVNA